MQKINLPTELPLKILQKLFATISNNDGQARLVGGCVRDIVVGKTSQDIDIATTLEPQKIIALSEQNNIKAIPTGIKHGTVTLIMSGQQFEVTTLRQDIKCFGRKAEVEFSENWQEDAARRDFTMNALYLDLNGNIYDYYNGVDDLKQGLVRFIGDAKQRLEEDYLRVMRYFRFLAYFGVSNIDQNSLISSVNAQNGLESISGERIWQELKKILTAEFANSAIQLMQKHGLFQTLFKADVACDTIALNPNSSAIINFTALVANFSQYDIGIISERIKLSKAEGKFIINCINNLALYDDKSLFYKTLCYKYGAEFYANFIELLQILGCQTNNRIDAKTWVIPKFPVKAADLNLSGAPLGAELKKLENQWIKSEFLLTKNELLK